MAYTPGGSSSGGLSLISDQTLASATATITFSSIPQTYRHLLLVTSLRDNSGQNTAYFAGLRVNGNTSAIYYTSVNYASSTGTPSAYGSEGLAINYVYPGLTCNSTVYTHEFARAESWILDYTSTSHPLAFVSEWSSVQETADTTGQLSGMSGGTINTLAAVTSLTLFQPNGFSFDVGSQATLYGVT